MHQEIAFVSVRYHKLTSYSKQYSADHTSPFLIGQDLESYSVKSGELIPGSDTSGTDINFSATFPNVANAAVVANDSLMNFYAHYDLILNIVDGQISAAF